jgi:hypothetical protein
MRKLFVRRGMAFRLAVVAGVVAGAAIGAFIAFSYFSSTTPAQANSVTAGVVGAGQQPTFVVSGRDVTLSWAAATNANAYTVARANGQSLSNTLHGSCASSVSGLTCADTGLPESGTAATNWTYTDTPHYNNWDGATSTSSATVTIPGPTLSLGATTFTTSGGTTSATVANFFDGEHVTYCLDQSSSCSAGNTLGTDTVPASGGTVTTASISIPAGLTTGAHTVYAIGDQGSLPTQSITINPGTVAKLVFSVPPGSATAGSAFGQQPVVKTQDAFGNDSTVGLGTSRNVTLSVASGGGTLGGTVTLDIGTAAGNGMVTFTNVRIDTAGSHTLQATAAAGSPSLASATSTAFTVAKASPTLSLAQSSAPSAGSGTAGTAIAASSITATLASGSGANAGGTVTFVYFQQPSAPTTCTSGGTTIGTMTVSGNGSYNPNVGFTPTVAGNYWLYASYGGDGNNNTANSTCPPGAAQEIVVAKASPTLTVSAPGTGTANVTIPAASITATLAASSGTNDTSAMTFTVFGPQASAPTTCTSGGTTVGTATPAGNGTYQSSAPFTPTQAGNYWWYVSSPSDANNNSTSSTCGAGMTETVVSALSINAVQVISATAWLAVGDNCSIYFGASNAAWTEVAKPSGCTSNLKGIDAAAATAGWIVGSGNTILTCSSNCQASNGVWSTVTASHFTSTTSLTGVTDNQAGTPLPLLVGNDGTSGVIGNCSATCTSTTGSTWNTRATLTNTTMNGVAGQAGGLAWAVGSNSSGTGGVVELCNSNCATTTASWSAMTSATISGNGALNAIAFADQNHVLAVGNGVIENCSANCNNATTATWTKQTVSGISSSTNLRGVAIRNNQAGPGVVVGDGGVIGYCSTHCADGTAAVTWTSEPSNTIDNLLGVGALFAGTGSALSTGVAVGANGDISTATAANSWLSPTAALSTNTAVHNVATTVTVSGGSGFTPTNGSAIKVVFNGSTLTTTPASVTTSGSAFTPSSFTFQTPTSLAAGTYEVIISDSVGDALVFTFTLT